MRFSDGVQADEAWIITNVGGLPARDVVVRLEWGGDYTEGDVALLDDAGAAGPPCTEGGLDVCAPFTLQPGQSRIAVGRLASTPFDPALPYTLTLGLVASSPDDPDAVNNGNVTISDYWGPLPPIDASTTMQFHPEAVRLPETGTTSSAALWWAVFVVLAGAGLASVARRRGEFPN